MTDGPALAQRCAAAPATRATSRAGKTAMETQSGVSKMMHGRSRYRYGCSESSGQLEVTG